MKVMKKKPPRVFKAGIKNNISILDCARIYLRQNEQVTFMTKGGREYDVTAKEWGFYATPSLNSRLKKQGFKTALVKNTQGRYFVMLVEKDKRKEFAEYLKAEKIKISGWLDE